MITNVIWNWWLYRYISSSTLLIKTILWLLFDKNKFVTVAFMANYRLNQPINFKLSPSKWLKGTHSKKCHVTLMGPISVPHGHVDKNWELVYVIKSLLRC